MSEKQKVIKNIERLLKTFEIKEFTLSYYFEELKIGPFSEYCVEIEGKIKIKDGKLTIRTYTKDCEEFNEDSKEFKIQTLEQGNSVFCSHKIIDKLKLNEDRLFSEDLEIRYNGELVFKDSKKITQNSQYDKIETTNKNSKLAYEIIQIVDDLINKIKEVVH